MIRTATSGNPSAQRHACVTAFVSQVPRSRTSVQIPVRRISPHHACHETCPMPASAQLIVRRSAQPRATSAHDLQAISRHPRTDDAVDRPQSCSERTRDHATAIQRFVTASPAMTPCRDRLKAPVVWVPLQPRSSVHRRHLRTRTEFRRTSTRYRRPNPGPSPSQAG